MPKIEMVLVLTDSRIVLTRPTGNKGELKISSVNYLDELEQFDEIATDRYAITFKDQQQKSILQFREGDSKQLVLSLRNRLSLLNGKPEEPKGNITALTAEELELKIAELLRLGNKRPDKSILEKLVHCLSDCIELYSEKDESKLNKYKQILDEVLKNQDNQRFLFE